MPPIVSIVMGVRNGAVHLRETIESALNQRYRDFELIAVDDGSTDPRVGEILNELAARDSRVRVLRQSPAGLTRALRAGCAIARGPYIARLDVGDVMLPDRLEAQKALLDAHPEAVLATCWTEFCGPCWEPLYTARNAPDATDENDYWVAAYPVDDDTGARKIGPTSHPSVVMRAHAYRTAGGYRAEFYCGQDWDLWFRLAELGPFAGVQRVLYRCRIFPDGISMRGVRMQRRIRKCALNASLARRAGGDERPYLEAASRLRLGPDAGSRGNRALRNASGHYFIGEALRRRGDRRCRRYFAEGLQRNPLQVKMWFRLLQAMAMAGK